MRQIPRSTNKINQGRNIPGPNKKQRGLVVREIFKLPYPSTLVGSSPLPSSYLVLTTFKRNHDKLSYYLKFSAIPLREHVTLLSRHTRWVAGSSVLSTYRFLQQLATVTTYVRRPNYYLRVRVVSLRLSSHTQAQASTIYTSIRYTSKARARWQRPGSFPRV